MNAIVARDEYLAERMKPEGETPEVADLLIAYLEQIG